jgi:hypothetical protein
MSATISPVLPSTAAGQPQSSSPDQNARLNRYLDRVEHALDGLVRSSNKTSVKIPAHETREQQQVREGAQAKITRKNQLVREAKEAEVTLRNQKEREAKEHGLPSPGGAANKSFASAATLSSTNLDASKGGARPVGITPQFNRGSQARLFSANIDRTEPSSGAKVSGPIGAGTHLLRPVPKNGGELSEAPTTVADINAIIKDIDSSLLTDPSQKGEGKLKGLPYGKMFEAAGKATGIDPAILYADSQVETGDNKNGRILVPNNINPIQTAPGVWPTTENAATNLFTGAYVMKDYINRADGDLKRGLNAYNTGNLAPSETGFADGYDGYYEGVMAAHANVQKAIKDPSIIEPGQGGNVSVASQI